MFHFPSEANGKFIGRTCPACAAAGSRPMFEKDGCQYVECSACGMTFINPIPAVETLAATYDHLSQEYFLDDRRLAVDEYPQRHARELELLRRVGSRGRLLDVGCATGSFLRAATVLGFTDVAGIDIAGPSIDAAKQMGLQVTAGEFSAGIFAAGTFDAVTMWNTLEHLPFPMDFIRESMRVLAPNGVLALSVPNYASLSVAILGRRYRYIGLAHLNYFTPSTLALVLRRAGLSVEYVETRSFNPYVVWQDLRGARVDTAEFIRETELSKSFKSKSGFGLARLAYTAVDRGLRLIGKGDSLLAIGRKPRA